LLVQAPLYKTDLGAAYCGDSLELMRRFPAKSVKVVVTSPPYALHFKKEYGNALQEKYVEWFLPFGKEIRRVLTDDGSFVLNIGGSYKAGTPTRSLYHYRLVLALCDEAGFHLAQECFWYNPARLPAPAEWVNVRRVRIKDSVEFIWWLTPTPWPDADNRRVLVPYSADMERLIERGFRAKKRPSGHNITAKFARRRAGAIPSNVIVRGNNESNSDYIKRCAELGLDVHPARYPAAIPDFFIRLLSAGSDIILDPFAGSNTTGQVAEGLGRRWISVEKNLSYLRASGIRFGLDPRNL
jgi:site-specific DNA-methyltransferase (cytosine-N4-specific)